jgi:RNA-directed DNA polymerase
VTPPLRTNLAQLGARCSSTRAAVTPSWANYFKHAVCKHTLGSLANFAWWRVTRWRRTLHRWGWKDVRRTFTTPNGRWKPVERPGEEPHPEAA